MKLLMITRRVDKDDPVASFAYNWVKKFAQNLDELWLICLEMGNTHGLPNNTFVYSLGKEKGKNRIKEFCRFQKYAFKIVPKVDGIFSHQNPEYGILIAPFAKIFRKKLIAWFVHGSVTWKLKLLNLLVDRMISINKESFRLRNKKKVVFLHHGIDTEKFYFSPKKLNTKKIKLLTVSRMSPSKNIDLMIEAVEKLNKEGETCLRRQERFLLDIYGLAVLESQRKYLARLKAIARDKRLTNQIFFKGGIANDQLPAVYQKADIFLNFSDTGSVDKAVLEAMSCGTLVLTTNEAFKDMLNKIDRDLYCRKNEIIFKIKDIRRKSDKIEICRQLSQCVKNHHSLNKLIKSIIKLYS